MELAIDILGMDGADPRRRPATRSRGPASCGDAAATATRVSPMQSSFFFSRSETIWGGTAEIQRNIVGERVLGLPREPKLEERAN